MWILCKAFDAICSSFNSSPGRSVRTADIQLFEHCSAIYMYFVWSPCISLQSLYLPCLLSGYFKARRRLLNLDGAQQAVSPWPSVRTAADLEPLELTLNISSIPHRFAVYLITSAKLFVNLMNTHNEQHLGCWIIYTYMLQRAYLLTAAFRQTRDFASTSGRWLWAVRLLCWKSTPCNRRWCDIEQWAARSGPSSTYLCQPAFVNVGGFPLQLVTSVTTRA